MKRGVVLLHGLPGVGKTTLAVRLARMLPDIHYVDMARHPEFRKRPMVEICVERHNTLGAGRSLLTEGVMPTPAGRDALIGRIIAETAASPAPLTDGLVIFIDDQDFKALSSRRNRTAEEYARLRHDLVVGSDAYDYIHDRATNEDRRDPDIRARRIARIINGWLREEADG